MKKKAGNKKNKKASFIVKAMTWLQIIAVTLLCGSAASVYISPEDFASISLLGIIFPICVAFITFTLVFSLLLSPKRSWISFLGIIVCIGSMRTYLPVNLSSPAPKSALKVVSYNVMGDGGGKKDENGTLHIINYIAKSNADIFCLQESCNAIFAKKNWNIIKPSLPYRDSVKIGCNFLTCFSKYPFVKKKLICQNERKSNGAAAFYLVPKRGDTIIVINCHLESHGISKDERKDYADLILNKEKKSVHTAFTIAKKIAKSSVHRAGQANQIAAFIEENQKYPIILMGDFNDTPISYTRYRMAEHLTDCFRATGNGVGRTFNRNAMLVRIDHIFCSSHFRPFACHVDDDKETSDHNPIFTYLVYKVCESKRQSSKFEGKRNVILSSAASACRRI